MQSVSSQSGGGAPVRSRAANREDAGSDVELGVGGSSSFRTPLLQEEEVGVTLLNKAAFAGKGAASFQYPYTLSAVHMGINWAGSVLALKWMQQERKKIARRNYRTVLMFSVVFSLNIAVGNMSLRYVSVNFNQVMRSLVPGAVMVLGTIVFGKTFSLRKKLSVLPVMVGVALACLGDMTFTTLGLVTTVFCVILAALKVALSGEMLTGEMKLPPLDLLATMTPLALAQTFALALFLGELTDIHRRWDELIGSGAWPPVILSGLLSFTLNITSFKANKLTSPLTLSIVANVKQVLLIALSTVLFDVPVAPINAVGIVIVILGSMRYSMISLEEKSL